MTSQNAHALTGTQHSGGILKIDLNAIRENYARLQAEVGPAVAVAAAVKANAYGLGVRHVAPTLYKAGCRRFFVATRDEALELREIFAQEVPIASDRVKIYLLNGVFTQDDPSLYQSDIVPVINSLEQLDLWTDAARPLRRDMTCVLQVDSGMSRYGLSSEEVRILDAQPHRLQGVSIDFVMSHLANADTQADPANLKQLTKFKTARATWPGLRASLAASSGIFLGPTFHFDVVRPGYALYGGNPTPNLQNPMRPVVTLLARLIQVRILNVGGRVGYGGVFTAQRPSRIATLAIGYADGILRAAGGKISVIHPDAPDILLPVIGRISMDSMAVDVTDLPAHVPLNTSTFLEVIGPHRLIDQVAQEVGTIGYELLASLGSRYHRIYIGNPE